MGAGTGRNSGERGVGNGEDGARENDGTSGENVVDESDSASRNSDFSGDVNGVSERQPIDGDGGAAARTNGASFGTNGVPPSRSSSSGASSVTQPRLLSSNAVQSQPNAGSNRERTQDGQQRNSVTQGQSQSGVKDKGEGS